MDAFPPKPAYEFEEMKTLKEIEAHEKEIKDEFEKRLQELKESIEDAIRRKT